MLHISNRRRKEENIIEENIFQIVQQTRNIIAA